jgi:hypothetical protein
MAQKVLHTYCFLTSFLGVERALEGFCNRARIKVPGGIEFESSQLPFPSELGSTLAF